MIRALFLTKYDNKAASTRLRMIQYFPLLERSGVACEISPLLNAAYLTEKFSSGRSSFGAAARAFFGRACSVIRAGRSDVVVIQCDLYPYVPGFFEATLRLRNIPYIYDYDDAIFHSYDMHPSVIVRRLLGDKIRNTIRGARAVLAGSPYLVEYARAVNPRVEWSPTCVDLSRYSIRKWTHSSPRFTIGWIGAPSSVQFVAGAISAIRQLGNTIPTRVVFVGSGPVTYPGCDIEIHEWSESTEVAEMLDFDVGIMPLPDEPWTRGKCSFKLIQYMACGLPVVASPVGMNKDVVDHGTNGFLANSTEEWLTALRALANSVDLRRRMGAQGRKLVEREYSTVVGGAKLLQAIRSSVKSPEN